MDRLDKQNKIIKELINEINLLLEEKEPINEILGLIKIGSKVLGPKMVNYFLKTGGEDFLKQKIKDKINNTKRNVSQDVKDFFKSDIGAGSYNIQKDVDEIEDIKKRIVSKLGSYEDFNDYEVSQSNFNTITVKFKDNFKLEVKADTGKEYSEKYRTYNTEKFDVVTTKKTSQGYILNLTNSSLPKNVSLLMYIDNYRVGGTIRAQLQLTYDNGRYNGNRMSGDVEIINLR
jgi:hypothetical protein